MKVSEILQEIAEFKTDDDFNGFKNLLESLDFTEVYQLKIFSKELGKYCDKILTEKI